jgi:Family of unknown function (DUF5677)
MAPYRLGKHAVPVEDSEENAKAFLEQIDSIKPTDVSLARTDGFTSEDDFNGLAVELLIEVGSLICVAGNLMPANTRRWDRNQAVLGGHLVRLYKLICALLDQICQRRREITFIIARLAFECIVNIRFLIKFGDAATYDSYVRYSLRQEKRLYERISKESEGRHGEKMPVEERMLASIDRTVKASGLSIEDLSPSRPKDWADKNLYERADAIGLGGTYIGTFGGPSSSVHGNWTDLLEFQLETHHNEGNFSPEFEWHNPRPQIGQTVALLAVDAAREYFAYVGGGPIQFMEDTFANLSNRIREAARAHEAFLNKLKE